jgi:hypothetical protein
VISGLNHSPVVTRAEKSLLGKGGVITACLWIASFVVVELEDVDCPRGIRRWTVSRDDLTFVGPYGGDRSEQELWPLGISNAGCGVVQHAVNPNTKAALCFVQVRSMLDSGWGLRFEPAAIGACPRCVELVTWVTEQGES